jgi:hypothetical protein
MCRLPSGDSINSLGEALRSLEGVGDLVLSKSEEGSYSTYSVFLGFLNHFYLGGLLFGWVFGFSC